jgi:hypothetical protein
LFTETLITRQPFIQTLIRGYRCASFSNALRMGPSSALCKAILQHRLCWVWWGPWGLFQRAMAGVKGRSGGRRAGAGRRPSATQIKMPKSKGINKASKSGLSPPDANATKLTTFFAPAPAAAAAVAAENVRAPPSIAGSQTSCLRHCCLLPLASAHSSSPLFMCFAPVTARSCDHA